MTIPTTLWLSFFWGSWSPESSSAENIQVTDIELNIGLRWSQATSGGCFSIFQRGTKKQVDKEKNDIKSEAVLEG